MTFKPRIWYPISAVLSVINLAAVWFAAGEAGTFHATAHAALALAFGLWAQRLRRALGGGEIHSGLEALDLDVAALRQELAEAQERLDFTERMLAQGAEQHRTEPRR